MLECTVNSARALATCKVGEIPSGENYKMTLNIPEMGSSDGEFSGFSSNYVITSYYPETGSKHGGTFVTIEGSGFQKNQVLKIDIDGVPTSCDSTGQAVEYTLLHCLTLENFVIQATDTPYLGTITQSKFSILGGETFTITGTQFTAIECPESRENEILIGVHRFGWEIQFLDNL